MARWEPGSGVGAAGADFLVVSGRVERPRVLSVSEVD